MRPHGASAGAGVGRSRRKGGRGRRTKASTTSSRPTPAADPAGADGGRRVSRSSSVAEEDDNGVVLVTYRQIKDDAKQPPAAGAGTADDSKLQADRAKPDDASQAEPIRPTHHQVVGQEDEEAEVDGEEEKGQGDDSSCASTMSSDEDTNVDFDSEDDSNDEEMSRTYRLRDGATLMEGLRQDDSTSRSSSSRSSVSGEPGAHGDDSDGARQQPFRRVFVVNSSPSTSPTPEDDAGAARSKGAATALSAAPGDSAPPPPRADRCAPRPRDAPPPPPAAPAAPAPCDTSQVPSDARTEAGRPRAAVTDADASSAVGAAIAAVTTPADASPVAAAEKDKQDAAQHVPPGLSVDQPEPQDGMTSPSPAAQACRPSDTAEDADMFGAEPQHGDSSAAAVAAINKQVIGQVAPAELAALGGHLECLSVIESAAGAGAGAPVALRDILKESLQPEAEEARSRSRRGSATSTASSLEFSGTESMELSPSGDRDLEGEQQEVCGGGRQAEAAERETAEVGEEEGEERGDSGPVSPLARGAGADPELPQQRRPAPAPAPGEEPVTRRAPSDDEVCAAPKYTSLVMITPPESPVSVSVGPARAPAVTLSHTNFEEAEAGDEAAPEEELGDDEDDDEEEVEAVPLPAPRRARPGAGAGPEEDVQVVTGGQTLSAVICLEEGLADDDSWVEEVEPDRDADMDMEATATDTSSGDEGGEGAAADREEELRGYHRAAIDFTLHTILEESCEESEAEQRTPPRPRAPASSELEKYFFFDLGGGGANGGAQQQDAMSETNSSIYSEGLESLGTEDGFPDEDNPPEQADPAELASSRLEKYFLSGFMGFPGSSRRDSDGSVGSDSEGRPSPEQRRKRLVRARGTGRPAHSSQDNLAAPALPAQPVEAVAEDEDEASEDGSTTEDEAGAPEEPALAVDGQFDTVKRKKRKRSVGSAPGLGGTAAPASAAAAPGSAAASSDERDVSVSPALVGQDLGAGVGAGLAASRAKQHSRDSGFVGSCDDLLNKSASDSSSSGAVSPAGGPADPCPVVSESPEEEAAPENAAPAVAAPVPAPGPAPSRTTTPPATSLTRRDSFNNWSSDEETNLMMSKMRAFFKNMTAPSQVAAAAAAAPAAPERAQAQGAAPGPPPARRKPPQLVYFESELTRLMKTVPGIRDEQVRELVEYLSSEDTWSDSYDSSDYTSSDLEGAAGHGSKRALQEQISASCQQIITNFDTAAEPRPEDDVVYQRLMASLSRMDDRAAGPAGGGLGPGRPRPAPPQPQASPPIFAKVMQHIGGRLVALMHEVSGGQGGPPGAPRERYVHRRLQQKVSVASTTTEEDEDSVTDTEPDRVEGADQEAEAAGASTLARSRSHDLLGASAGLPHDHNADEREASDYERFSWRGSFESALMAADSRSRLSCGGSDVMSASVSTAAKRRSAGDLLYSHRSREHLDRVRSCGSIGGIGAGPAGPGAGGRRASVPDTSGGSADGDEDDDDDDDDDLDERGDDHGDLDLADVSARSTTLPRSLQATRGAGTNSLPRLPTSGAGAGTALLKMNAQGALGQVQSARYRPPGYSRQPSPSPSPQAQPALGNPPKRAMSAPGLGPHQPAPHPRRERRKHLQQSSQGEFSVAAIRGAELKLKGDESCPEASPRLSGPAPSPLSSRAAGAGAGAPGLSRAATLSSASSLKAAAAVRDWLPDDDILAGRLPALGGPLVSNLGRSDSLASVYSGAGEGRYGTVAVRGEVEFGLQYNYKQNALEIHVVQCRDLAPVDTKRNRSDPYVKVYLLPDKSKGGKRKTRVKKHTLNPYFDETLKFHISLKGLESRTLWLTVWHSDMFGRNDFLGEVMMGLENKVFDDPSPCFYTLQERTEPYDDVNSYRGDMIVALKFVPPDVSCSTLGKKGKRSSKGELHILVKEAKNLTANKASGSCDAFCKSYLLPDKGKSSKQKTAVIRRSCNPAWNHTFIYPDISLQELSERSLELTVWDHDRIASNEFLGGMRFNLGTGKHYGKPVDWMDSSGKELTLWQRMLERPNLWVESSIMLRPSLDRTAISSSSVT